MQGGENDLLIRLERVACKLKSFSMILHGGKHHPLVRKGRVRWSLQSAYVRHDENDRYQTIDTKEPSLPATKRSIPKSHRYRYQTIDTKKQSLPIMDLRTKTLVMLSESTSHVTMLAAENERLEKVQSTILKEKRRLRDENDVLRAEHEVAAKRMRLLQKTLLLDIDRSGLANESKRAYKSRVTRLFETEKRHSCERLTSAHASARGRDVRA